MFSQILQQQKLKDLKKRVLFEVCYAKLKVFFSLLPYLFGMKPEPLSNFGSDSGFAALILMRGCRDDIYGSLKCKTKIMCCILELKIQMSSVL